VGTHSAHALHLKRVPLRRPVHPGYRMLRWTDLPMAGGAHHPEDVAALPAGWPFGSGLVLGACLAPAGEQLPGQLVRERRDVHLGSHGRQVHGGGQAAPSAHPNSDLLPCQTFHIISVPGTHLRFCHCRTPHTYCITLVYLWTFQFPSVVRCTVYSGGCPRWTRR